MITHQNAANASDGIKLIVRQSGQWTVGIRDDAASSATQWKESSDACMADRLAIFIYVSMLWEKKRKGRRQAWSNSAGRQIGVVVLEPNL